MVVELLNKTTTNQNNSLVRNAGGRSGSAELVRSPSLATSARSLLREESGRIFNGNVVRYQDRNISRPHTRSRRRRLQPHHQVPAQIQSGTVLRHNKPFVFNGDARAIDRTTHKHAHAEALRTFAPESRNGKGLIAKIIDGIKAAFSPDPAVRKEASMTAGGWVADFIRAGEKDSDRKPQPAPYAFNPQGRELTGQIGPRELHRAAA